MRKAHEQAGLDGDQVAQFIEEGYARVDDAFPPALAAAAREILWRDIDADPADRSTWTQPVVRLGFYGQRPFVEAAHTPCLAAAFDQLVGPGRWLPPTNLGTFPVRFPSEEDPGDTGWHVDASFDHDRPDFLDWRVNVSSRGRALLMLFLFSDVGEADAPTRLRAGSHQDVARLLAPAGEAGLTLRQLVAAEFGGAGGRPERFATGPAGTVYLCHPFLVHAAQIHRGNTPRFLAQPPLLPAAPIQLERPDADYAPIERAIRRALGAP